MVFHPTFSQFTRGNKKLTYRYDQKVYPFLFLVSYKSGSTYKCASLGWPGNRQRWKYLFHVHLPNGR